MSVTITYPLDPVQVAELIADSWTTLTLWYSNTPDGVYTNSAASPTPATLAALSTALDTTPATATSFAYSAGSPALWFKVLAYDGSGYSALSDASPFPGGGGTTLTALRQQLGDEIRDMRIGTCTTSTSTTQFVTTTGDLIRFQDNYFNRWYLHNTTQHLWAPVTLWTQSTGIGTNPTITGQATGDNIELTRRFTPDEYRKAINYAISASYPVLSKTIVNTSIVTSTNLYEYAVPHDIKSVSSVEVESAFMSTSTVMATRGHPWEHIPYRIIRDGLRQKIEFEEQPAVSRRLRVIGTGPLSQLYNDTDYVEEIDPQLDILIYFAAFHLYRGLPNEGAGSDIDRYKELAEHYWNLARNLKDSYMQSRPAKRMWGETARAARSNGASGSFDPSTY